jgi:Reverse transcriptase (RNA-dependent DNA polymerase)
MNKVFDSTILARISPHIEKNNIFYKHQFGLRLKCSTTVAFTEVVSIGMKKIVAGLFLDLKKDFDTIDLDQEILLNKPEKIGISGILNDLIRSYLSQRSQYVKIGEDISEYLLLSLGVPQGSVLGTLLFNIYANDISQLPLRGSVRMFADDSALFIHLTH